MKIITKKERHKIVVNEIHESNCNITFSNIKCNVENVDMKEVK